MQILGKSSFRLSSIPTSGPDRYTYCILNTVCLLPLVILFIVIYIRMLHIYIITFCIFPICINIVYRIGVIKDRSLYLKIVMSRSRSGFKVTAMSNTIAYNTFPFM